MEKSFKDATKILRQLSLYLFKVRGHRLRDKMRLLYAIVLSLCFLSSVVMAVFSVLSISFTVTILATCIAAIDTITSAIAVVTSPASDA